MLPRGVGRAFVDHRSAAVGERAIDDIAVPCHPADVGGAPIHILFWSDVEHRFVRESHLCEIAACGVHDAFRLGGGAGGVEQIQQVLGLKRLGGADGGGGCHGFVPPDVSVWGHGWVGAAAIHHHHMAHRFRPLSQSSIHIRLQRRGLASAIAGIGGDDHLGFGVFAAVDYGIRRKPAEDNRMRRSDASASQHRHRQLWDHRHIYRHTVARCYAEAEEHIGELLSVGEQVGIGDGASVARFALPEIRHPAAQPGFHMAIQAVIGSVELAVCEPAGIGQVPVQRGAEVGLPAQQLTSLARPESFVVGSSLFVERAVGSDSGGGKLRRWRESALFGVIVFYNARHGFSSDVWPCGVFFDVFSILPQISPPCECSSHPSLLLTMWHQQSPATDRQQ